jgi:hypothetical protein
MSNQSAWMVGTVAGLSAECVDHQRATNLDCPLELFNLTFTEIQLSLSGSVAESWYEPFLELKDET